MFSPGGGLLVVTALLPPYLQSLQTYLDSTDANIRQATIRLLAAQAAEARAGLEYAVQHEPDKALRALAQEMLDAHYAAPVPTLEAVAVLPVPPTAPLTHTPAFSLPEPEVTALDNLVDLPIAPDDAITLADTPAPTTPPFYFLIDPRNRAFAEGRTRKPVYDELVKPLSAWSALAVALAAAAMVGLCSTLTLGLSGLTAPGRRLPVEFAPALFAFLAFAVATFVSSRRARHEYDERLARNERLLAASRLVDGRVLAATGNARSLFADDDDLRAVDFEVIIRYAFVSPLTGLTLERTARRARPDLSVPLLPPPGTPVKVYYADDLHFNLL
jgi:hypothetical protein